MLNHSVFLEGVAAGKLNVPRDRNPYRIAAYKSDESILWEQASDWESGWIKGNKGS